MSALEINHEFSESDWIQSESIRRLMQPRSTMMSFATLTMVIMAIQLYGHVNTVFVVSWLLLSLILTGFRYQIKRIFIQRIASLNVASQSAFIKRYSIVWIITALVWGISGWLSFTNLPVQNLYICATVLNLVGFIGVLNLTYHKHVVTNFVNILMGSQVLAVVLHIGLLGKFHVPALQYVHLISLIIIWGMLHTIHTRFHIGYLRNLKLLYHNHHLIKNLNRQAEQLAHEKQIALNANEVIQRFYSSAAHDIRQPVYALKVYADMAKEDTTQIPKLLSKMTESCDAINTLFDSLFEFEQINSGHINVSHQTVDIDEVMDDLELQFKPFAKHKSLEFRINAISGYLQTDQLLVKRILTAFISNAVKYTEKGGILVAVRKASTGIDFEVWDTGIGIDKLHQTHVFEEFYKVGISPGTMKVSDLA